MTWPGKAALILLCLNLLPSCVSRPLWCSDDRDYLDDKTVEEVSIALPVEGVGVVNISRLGLLREMVSAGGVPFLECTVLAQARSDGIELNDRVHNYEIDYQILTDSPSALALRTFLFEKALSDKSCQAVTAYAYINGYPFQANSNLPRYQWPRETWRALPARSCTFYTDA